jgi:hypothetical protein
MQMRNVLLGVLLAGLLAASLPADEPVQLKRAGDTVEVVIQGQPFTTFFFGADSPKPYLHPLRTASGKVVTRGFPMIKDDPEEIRTKSQDHPHHRGLFYAHGDTNGVDFWSEGAGKGRIVFRALNEVRSGETGALMATFDWVTPEGKTLLTETKRLVFRGRADARFIDVEETLQIGRAHV